LKNYLIFAPEYDENIGGICALHFLADRLIFLGVKNVFLTSPRKNNRWNANLLDSFLQAKYDNSFKFRIYKILLFFRKLINVKTVYRKINRKILTLYPLFIWKFLNIENTVVIYPENIKGNPMGAKHIVRWVLNDPDESKGFGVFNESDHIFKYFDFYKVNSRYSIKGVLTAIDLSYHLKTYQNRNHNSRDGGAFLIKKGHHKTLNKHPNNFKFIDNIFLKFNDEEKAEFFNTIKTFISYDHMTFLSVQAALCGCESIIIPDESGSYSAEELKRKNRLFGIAYGYDDLVHAKTTLPMLRGYYEDLNDQYLQTIIKFKAYCENHIFREDE